MEKKEIKRQIELLQDQMTDLRNQIDGDEKEFKFEAGWYKHTDNQHSNWIIYTDKDDNYYGIGEDGRWTDGKGMIGYIGMHCEKTIKKEVETALKKEATKRGFKEGVCFNSLDNHNSWGHIGGFKLELKDYRLLLWANKWYDPNSDYKDDSKGNITIFENGKWAEIIENTLTIHGEKMTQEGDIISFGCAKFNKHFFNEAYSMTRYLNGKKSKHDLLHRGIQVDNNRKIASIKLDSGKELTIEQLKEIVDHIK